MNKKVVFCAARDKLLDVVSVMKKKGISQVPVLEKSRVLGVVSERAVLEAIGKFGASIGSKKAEDVMDECPPIVTINTGQKMIVEMLKEYSIVLVSQKGDIVGLVSKADLLDAL